MLGGVQSRVGPELLRLLVQLHVGHQDVLLGLLVEAWVGAAVARPLEGTPRPCGSPPVQVDHSGYQQKQHQSCHYDDDQSRQVVDIHWEKWSNF